tara:strand:+ start:111 stop:530 length:420 start_codon:yes stop_codon:yes gene_type:complete
MNKIINGWEMCEPKSERLYAFGDDEYFEENFKEDYPLLYKEQRIIQDMLKLFISGEYGYYFSETHEHERPEELDDLEYNRVYYTPLPLYYETGEYNCIDVAYSKDYVYYAISLHGCSFSSALTEYVKVYRNHRKNASDQ